MNTWASGYVSDIEYTHGSYRELSPSFLHYVCLTQGVRPPSLAAGATYCDLGCGQGVGTAIVAATHPRMKVWGIDFNPTQIANARRLAGEAGLDNLTFLDCSFEQALEKPHGTFPEFDYIVLHGIYSWVSQANRRAIVAFIDRHLKVGGAAYICYNALPGWSDKAPLQRLMLEHAARHPDRSDLQAKAGLQFANELAQAKAHYFSQNPGVGKHLEERATDSPQYLAHEYLNQHWSPLYHADLVRDLDPARLTYVGSAGLVENNDRLSVPERVAAMIAESSDPVWRETLRDYARNQKFRRDIFMRGAPAMKPLEQSEALAAVRIALMGDRASASHTFQTPNGNYKGNEELFVPLFDAMGEKPCSIGELMALPGLRAKPKASVLEAINISINFGQAHPLVPVGVGDGANKPGLNKAIASRIRNGEVLGHVAAQAAGVGISVSYVELIAILALAEGVKADPTEVARFAWPLMQRTGHRMIKDKVTLQSPEDNIAELERQLRRLFAGQLRVWKTLGVV